MESKPIQALILRSSIRVLCALYMSTKIIDEVNSTFAYSIRFRSSKVQSSFHTFSREWWRVLCKVNSYLYSNNSRPAPELDYVRSHPFLYIFAIVSAAFPSCDVTARVMIAPTDKMSDYPHTAREWGATAPRGPQLSRFHTLSRSL